MISVVTLDFFVYHQENAFLKSVYKYFMSNHLHLKYKLKDSKRNILYILEGHATLANSQEPLLIICSGVISGKV